MNGKGFSLYESLVFGFRLTLDNVRLFFKLMITVGALVIGTFLIVGGFNFAVLGKYLLSMKPQLEALRTCTGQQCATAAQGLVKPLLAMIFSAGWLVALSILLIIFAFCMITVGYKKVALHVHDGKTASVGTFFEAWRFVPKYFITSIIYLFIITVGFMLFIIPGIFWMVRFGFFGYFIVDKNAGIFESLSRSFRLTRGYVIELIGLMLLIMAINSIGFFAILVLAPVAMLSQVYIYRTLSSE